MEAIASVLAAVTPAAAVGVVLVAFTALADGDRGAFVILRPGFGLRPHAVRCRSDPAAGDISDGSTIYLNRFFRPGIHPRVDYFCADGTLSLMSRRASPSIWCDTDPVRGQLR